MGGLFVNSSIPRATDLVEFIVSSGLGLLLFNVPVSRDLAFLLRIRTLFMGKIRA